MALIRLKKTIRQPFTLILFLFNIAVVILSASLPFFTFVKSLELKMFLDIVIASTFIISSITTIYFASTSVSEEISDKTIFAIFSKPVSKFSYLFGNFLGLTFVSIILYSFTYIIVDFAYSYNHFNIYCVSSGKIGLFDFISIYLYDILHLQQNLSFDGYLLKPSAESLIISFSSSVLSFFLISFMNTLFIVSISVALSPFVPFGLNLLICLFVFSLSNVGSFIAENIPYLGDLLVLTLPRMDLFNISDALTLGINFGVLFLLKLFLYSTFYSCFIIFISSKLLERKEFV